MGSTIPWFAEAPTVASGFSQGLPAARAPTQPPPSRLPAPGKVLDTPTREPLRVIVRRGESFWRFDERIYGDGRRWKRVALANNFLLRDLNNPNLIDQGQEFLIPPLPAAH